ncbi:hypothetical protein CYMTET_6491 [Cymbomonas tetramitiformis]|uniref:Uncharacterized protein n=1 Tax=Cymbomonas tetramitiformis TaxID=36881 RepID=A0AAE0GYV9_9CHLO|nr:hypothetical protein CYMTET_6491 [Cymbomonas tetramitiformis]
MPEASVNPFPPRPFVEDRVYQAADGVVAAELLQQWLNDFDDKNRGKAMLSATLKSAANADARVVKDHRAQRWKVERKTYDDEKDTKPAGKGGKGWGAKPTMRDVCAATPSSTTALSGR